VRNNVSWLSHGCSVQVMLETCRGRWFWINWTKSASRWFHHTDVTLLCYFMSQFLERNKKCYNKQTSWEGVPFVYKHPLFNLHLSRMNPLPVLTLRVFNYYTIFLLQLGWHSVAIVQYTFKHKQYTEYRERNIHNNKKKLGSAGRAPSLRVIPWHLPYIWGKSTGNPQF
jgi:hypothetical protein